MPIKHAIWRVSERPSPLLLSSLQAESVLEKMIAVEPSILSDGWLLIGRQVRTEHGGLIDLLAIDADGQLILIELKKHLTPRDVVAQALDYASWIQDLPPERLAEIFQAFTNGRSLDDAFRQKFGVDLDEEQLDGSHQIVIVAASLDASTERIVKYLSDRDLPINVVFFQVFQDAENQFLSRSFLIDPVENERKALPSKREARGPWNGEYYVSFGHGEGRDWADAVKYGFISAGGGIWYSRTLKLLSPDDRFWVLVPKQGYVGVGKVLGPPVRASEFFVEENGQKKHIFDVTKRSYHRQYAEDEDLTEVFVPVQWTKTRALKDAFSEVGLFGNQNTVCQPKTVRWDHTVKRLKQVFQVE